MLSFFSVAPSVVDMVVSEFRQKHADLGYLESRFARAVEIAHKSGQVHKVNEIEFEVRSQSNPLRFHSVNRQLGTCSCWDFKQGSEGNPSFRCKHQMTVFLVRRAAIKQQQFDREWNDFIRKECDGVDRARQLSAADRQMLERLVAQLVENCAIVAGEKLA